jgi:hypothetical protein
MAFSQNRYSANDRSVIVKYAIGQTKSVNLRKGSTGALLAHMANWFDANIRDIDPGQLDEWGYAERLIRGGVETSNHASGTAVDVDATKWPLGSEPSKYLTAAEIARIREHLKVYEGCIRWGGDYTGRKDPMHFEINRDQATCDRVWAKLQSQGDDMPISNEDADLLWRKPALEYGVPPIIWLKDARNDTAVIRSTLVALDKDLRLDLAKKQKQLDESAQREAALLAALDTLTKAAAGGGGVDADALRKVIREEMAKTVDVQISVRDDSAA